MFIEMTYSLEADVYTFDGEQDYMERTTLMRGRVWRVLGGEVASRSSVCLELEGLGHVELPRRSFQVLRPVGQAI